MRFEFHNFPFIPEKKIVFSVKELLLLPYFTITTVPVYFNICLMFVYYGKIIGFTVMLLGDL